MKEDVNMRIVLIMLFTFVFSVCSAQKEKGEVRSGNKAYEKGDIERAELEYRRALEQSPESVFARYNLGNALYKRGNAQEAEKVVAPLKDSMVIDGAKSKVFHNLGNYSLDQKKYSEAVEHYKSSLRDNPNDMETKANLAYAQKMLKDEQDKEKNKDQNKDNKDNKDKKEDPKDDKQDPNKDKQDPNKENEQNQPPPKITPQAAQQMLQAIQNKEKETQEKVDKEKAKVMESRQKEKNW
jgi:Ca-activated chloride channel homolog